MMLQAMGALVSTLGRRLRHGPLRPSWSLLFETSICLLRRTSQRAASLDPLGERALWATMKAPPAKVFASVTQRDDTLAFLDAETAEIRKLDWQAGKRGQHNRRHDAVTQIALARNPSGQRQEPRELGVNLPAGTRP